MEDLDRLYREYKPLLFSIAYRMLGSVTDAEDMVQDTFLNAQRVSGEAVGHSKAYLCKMVVNRCIDYAQSARKQREVYVGPWLPEPLLQSEGDPLHAVERDETLSYAFMVCLERLTPVERAVFILREAFAYAYAEIADIIGKTEANCRQLYRRVKTNLQSELPAPPPKLEPASSRHLLEQFLYATQTGDMGLLLRALSEDVAVYSDGGGKVLAAIRPIVGPEHVVAFLVGIGAKQPAGLQVELVVMNGQLGVLMREEGRIRTVINHELDADGRVRRLYFLRNPDKLQSMERSFEA